MMLFAHILIGIGCAFAVVMLGMAGGIAIAWTVERRPGALLIAAMLVVATIGGVIGAQL